MARHSRRHRTRSRKMRGGGGAEYVYNVVGSGDSQYSRTLDQSGAYGQIPGNVIIGAQGQNITSSTRIPTSSELSAAQGGGRRRRRGGFLGEVVNQAIVPLALVGMQQTYRRKRGGRNSSRKYYYTRRYKRHRR
jgi:hypothetical protein